MKKTLLLVVSFFLFSFSSVYADDFVTNDDRYLYQITETDFSVFNASTNALLLTVEYCWPWDNGEIIWLAFGIWYIWTSSASTTTFFSFGCNGDYGLFIFKQWIDANAWAFHYETGATWFTTPIYFAPWDTDNSFVLSRLISYATPYTYTFSTESYSSYSWTAPSLPYQYSWVNIPSIFTPLFKDCEYILFGDTIKCSGLSISSITGTWAISIIPSTDTWSTASWSVIDWPFSMTWFLLYTRDLDISDLSAWVYYVTAWVTFVWSSDIHYWDSYIFTKDTNASPTGSSWELASCDEAWLLDYLPCVFRKASNSFFSIIEKLRSFISSIGNIWNTDEVKTFTSWIIPGAYADSWDTDDLMTTINALWNSSPASWTLQANFLNYVKMFWLALFVFFCIFLVIILKK